jgi:hypothetical protein
VRINLSLLGISKAQVSVKERFPVFPSLRNKIHFEPRQSKMEGGWLVLFSAAQSLCDIENRMRAPSRAEGDRYAPPFPA